MALSDLSSDVKSSADSTDAFAQQLASELQKYLAGNTGSTPVQINIQPNGSQSDGSRNCENHTPREQKECNVRERRSECGSFSAMRAGVFAEQRAGIARPCEWEILTAVWTRHCDAV